MAIGNTGMFSGGVTHVAHAQARLLFNRPEEARRVSQQLFTISGAVIAD
jgi:hypothetical protein